MIDNVLLVGIFGALGFLYVQLFKIHGCQKRIEATLKVYMDIEKWKVQLVQKVQQENK